MSQRTVPTPIDETIATWSADDFRLVGGRCQQCATVTFPRLDGCPKCGSDDTRALELSQQGTLWTWTTQEFQPKRPYVGRHEQEPFTPYLLGYVELEEGVKVEARLVDCDTQSVHIGMPMELTRFDFQTADERGAVAMFAFRPCAPMLEVQA